METYSTCLKCNPKYQQDVHCKYRNCELHCHDKYNKCINFIDDCIKHFMICRDEYHSDLHDECACKDPGY